ncbi:Eco57I restriction-modification methylase domain-containing protein [Mammaliicoccus fleurettii]|uniref:Eco57I restriction-modification methylase domain-containing protein n=1 Tax=Mammaliicoccus fleurettii TaxID=150056 RepID=UPI002DBD9AED|nr:Eco57I restriction-modification methylase domain-containing protein [Mammaliicoccus fleurettii]MEB7779970.1 Eco57I restriction-modification methylase domain-containing protein [Mammaliicoccus fleurettii]
MKRNLKKIIKQYNLHFNNELKKFIENNPENLDLNDLSIIAELNNSNRGDTAAYYTDYDTLEILNKQLPDINKDIVYILEPSVGIGNFLDIIIKKYKEKNKVFIDVVDIDKNSIELLKVLNKYREIPSNIFINYIINDYMEENLEKRYDLIIGNPPFLKKNKVTKWNQFAKDLQDYTSKNIASFFMQKSLANADNVLLIMPKYFLSNSDFLYTRNICSKFAINKIVDFGESGFKGVLIETIALLINTKEKPKNCECISITKGFTNIQSQQKLIDRNFPNWLLYRDEYFDNIVKKMKLSVFNVVRDRGITTKMLNSSEGIRVLKSRNISRDGNEILDIQNYDGYIEADILSKLPINKYRFRDDVYLSPNMTYYPRVIKKPNDCVTNGSVAILINKENDEIRKEHLEFWNSEKFDKFYAIARNYSTRSLNIDANSVKYFGLYEGNMND